MIRQLVYISSVKGDPGAINPDAILHVSRRNNARSGVTGLLYYDGRWQVDRRPAERSGRQGPIDIHAPLSPG